MRPVCCRGGRCILFHVFLCDRYVAFAVPHPSGGMCSQLAFPKLGRQTKRPPIPFSEFSRQENHKKVVSGTFRKPASKTIKKRSREFGVLPKRSARGSPTHPRYDFVRMSEGFVAILNPTWSENGPKTVPKNGLKTVRKRLKNGNVSVNSSFSKTV